MLFVHHGRSQPIELQLILDQSVCADHEIDGPVTDPLHEVGSPGGARRGGS